MYEFEIREATGNLSRTTVGSLMDESFVDAKTIVGKANPDAASRVVVAMAIIYGSQVIARAIEAGFNNLSSSENLRSDHPLMGETFSGISEALTEIAEAIKEK